MVGFLAWFTIWISFALAFSLTASLLTSCLLSAYALERTLLLAVLAGSNSAWFATASSIHQPMETPLLLPIFLWSLLLPSVSLSLVQVGLEPSLAKSSQWNPAFGVSCFRKSSVKSGLWMGGISQGLSTWHFPGWGGATSLQTSLWHPPLHRSHLHAAVLHQMCFSGSPASLSYLSHRSALEQTLEQNVKCISQFNTSLSGVGLLNKVPYSLKCLFIPTAPSFGWRKGGKCVHPKHREVKAVFPHCIDSTHPW